MSITSQNRILNFAPVCTCFSESKSLANILTVSFCEESKLEFWIVFFHNIYFPAGQQFHHFRNDLSTSSPHKSCYWSKEKSLSRGKSVIRIQKVKQTIDLSSNVWIQTLACKIMLPSDVASKNTLLGKINCLGMSFKFQTLPPHYIYIFNFL